MSVDFTPQINNFLSAELGEEVRGSLVDIAEALEDAINSQLTSVDPTLSVPGAGADAGAVGAALSQLVNIDDEQNRQLVNYNACDLLRVIPISENTNENNGITYAWDRTNEQYVVNGAATALSIHILSENVSSIPYPFKAGGTYKLNYDTENSDVVFQVLTYTSGSDEATAQIFSEDGTFTIPANAIGLTFRLRVAFGKTINNAAVKFRVQSVMSNADLEKAVEAVNALFSLNANKQLLDPAEIVDGYFINTVGDLREAASFCYQTDIAVPEGRKIAISGGRHITCYFDANGTAVTGGADVSADEVLTLPKTVHHIAVSFPIVNKYKMVVADSSSVITKSQAVDKLSENLLVPSAINFTTVTIGTEFSNIRAALEYILTVNTDFYNRFVVRIPAGTYDIKSLFTAEERAAAGFKGLYVPPFTKLLGLGNPDDVLIKWENDSSSSTISTLNLDCTAELENLMVYGSKIRYAVHDDFSKDKWRGVAETKSFVKAFTELGYKRVIKNCIIEVNQSPVQPAWGAGNVDGAQWIFDRCVFITNQRYAFSCHNNVGYNFPTQIRFTECEFKNDIAASYFARLMSLTTDAGGILNNASFIGCRYVSGNKILLGEEDAQTYGAGCLWSVTGTGNQFSASDVEISVTDGQDYSDQNMLI